MPSNSAVAGRGTGIDQAAPVQDEGPVITMVLQLASVLAAQVAFAVVRARTEQQFGEARNA